MVRLPHLRSPGLSAQKSLGIALLTTVALLGSAIAPASAEVKIIIGDDYDSYDRYGRYENYRPYPATIRPSSRSTSVDLSIDPNRPTGTRSRGGVVCCVSTSSGSRYDYNPYGRGTLVNPTIINSEINDSTLINPTIINSEINGSRRGRVIYRRVEYPSGYYYTY